MNDNDYVFGIDMAKRDGFAKREDWIKALSKKHLMGGVIEAGYTGKKKGQPVSARLDFERWLCDCPDPGCGGAELVDLDEKIFFCLSCGNSANNGDAYPVKFPAKSQREAIYAELQKREQNRPPQQSKLLRAFNSRPKIPGLSRSWNPGETVADLKSQREKAEKHQRNILQKIAEKAG